MAVTWDLNRGLAGMFGQWSQDRHKAINDQAEFERQEKIAQANMKRDQEMYTWKTRRETEAQEKLQMAEAEKLRRAGYSDEEIAAHQTGAGTRFDTKLDQETQLAGAKADATMAAQQKALDQKYQQMYPELTEAERQSKVAEDMRRSQMTAAEKNEEAVMGILSKYEGQENPQYTATDKTKLAIYGVKVGTDAPKPMSPEVKQKYWDAARKEAVAQYNPDLVSDADAINQVQAQFANAGKQAPKMTGESARKWLVDKAAFNGYVTAVNTVTGQMPTSTPQGQAIEPPAAAAAVAEVTGAQAEPEVEQALGGGPVMEGTQAAKDQANQQSIQRWKRRNELKKQQEGQQSIPWGGGGMPATKPQAGKWKLPEQQDEAALGGDTRVNDIIGRMRQ